MMHEIICFIMYTQTQAFLTPLPNACIFNVHAPQNFFNQIPTIYLCKKTFTGTNE